MTVVDEADSRGTVAAQVSSLYPIDLTACLFHQIADPTSRAVILLNDALDYSESAQRDFIARTSLPIHKWQLTADNSWQQSHVSLDVNEGDAFALLARHMIEPLTPTDSGAAIKIAAHCDLLKRGLSKAAHDKGGWLSNWSFVSAQFLRTIFSELSLHAVQIAPYSPRRNGTILDDLTVQSVLDLVRRTAPRREISLTSGSRVLCRRSAQVQWSAFSSIEAQGTVFRLFNSPSSEELTIDTADIAKYNWRYKGPVEMLLLRQYGLLADLPWYALDTEFLGSKSDADGVEIISPLHFSDPARANAHRLIPTGYTLLEYNHPVVESFVKETMRIPSMPHDAMADAREFIRCPPPTSHRFTKHQRSARAYRNRRAEHWRQRFLAQGPEALDLVLNCEEPTHPLRLGDRLSAMQALVTILREYKKGFLRLSDYRSLESALVHSRILGSQNEVDIALLTKMFMKHRGELASFLTLHGAVLPHLDISALHGSTEQTRTLTVFRNQYRVLADDYYAWLAFIMAGPLKAHIFNLFTLIGPADLPEVISSILKQRKQVTLPFRLNIGTSETHNQPHLRNA
jgi:hypothetical protein